MSVTVVKAQPADAAELLRYLAQVGGETDNLTFGAEGLPFTAEEEAAVIAAREDSRDSVMLLAKDGERIVGCASFSGSFRRMGHRGDAAVSVAKAYWGQGVGRALMEGLIAFARENGFTLMDLQVRADNHRAIRLYEKLGFQKIGTHPAFFRMEGRDIPFELMVLPLA